MGLFKIESLECCIHFVSTVTFAAVKIFKDKIRIEFSLNHKIIHPLITQVAQMSKNRFLHCVNVFTDADINKELVGWIREAQDKK